MEFFDCNVAIGVPMNRPANAWGPPVASACDLMRHMDRAGVRKAVVWHVMQRDHHPVIGNEQLAHAIRGNDRLIGCWALLPNHARELGDLDAFFAAAKRANVRAFRVFPSTNRFVLNRRALGEVMDRLIQSQAPLFIRMDETSWENLYSLLGEAPDLRVVLTNMGMWGSDRYFRPLMESHRHVYIETSSHIVDGGIESFVADYGAERLLFGSAFPDSYMGAMMLALAHAEISEADKRAIASGNLERLLSEVSL